MRHVITLVMILLSLEVGAQITETSLMPNPDSAHNPIYESKKSSKTGISIGSRLGFYNNGESSGLGAGIEINFHRENYFFGADISKFEELTFFVSPSNKYTQINIFRIGKRFGEEYFWFQPQCGFGIFSGVVRKSGSLSRNNACFLCADYQTTTISSFAIVPKAGIRFSPAKFLSIGADFEVNMNFHQPMLMGFLTLEIGNVR